MQPQAVHSEPIHQRCSSRCVTLRGKITAVAPAPSPAAVAASQKVSNLGLKYSFARDGSCCSCCSSKKVARDGSRKCLHLMTRRWLGEERKHRGDHKPHPLWAGGRLVEYVAPDLAGRSNEGQARVLREMQRWSAVRPCGKVALSKAERSRRGCPCRCMSVLSARLLLECITRLLSLRPAVVAAASALEPH